MSKRLLLTMKQKKAPVQVPGLSGSGRRRESSNTNVVDFIHDNLIASGVVNVNLRLDFIS